MLTSKVKYGDQKGHAVTAAFSLFQHDHASTLVIYTYVLVLKWLLGTPTGPCIAWLTAFTKLSAGSPCAAAPWKRHAAAPLWARPSWASVGPYGPGPYGPWALIYVHRGWCIYIMFISTSPGLCFSTLLVSK